MKRIVRSVIGGLLVWVVAACGNGDSGNGEVVAQATTTLAPITIVEVTTSIPTPTNETAAPVATQPYVAPVAATMPDVVCMNLQDAQDRIQQENVFYSRSQDATGQDRMQVIDSNWIVVEQQPSPGSPFGEGDAVLFVVKYGESPNPC